MYKMESYCVKYKKYTENINPEVSSTTNGRVMILSKCAICNSKKSRFIKNQEAKGLLSKLGIKTPLSKIPIPFNIAKNRKYDGINPKYEQKVDR